MDLDEASSYMTDTHLVNRDVSTNYQRHHHHQPQRPPLRRSTSMMVNRNDGRMHRLSDSMHQRDDLEEPYDAHWAEMEQVRKVQSRQLQRSRSLQVQYHQGQSRLMRRPTPTYVTSQSNHPYHDDRGMGHEHDGDLVQRPGLQRASSGFRQTGLGHSGDVRNMDNNRHRHCPTQYHSHCHQYTIPHHHEPQIHHQQSTVLPRQVRRTSSLPPVSSSKIHDRFAGEAPKDSSRTVGPNLSRKHSVHSSLQRQHSYRHQRNPRNANHSGGGGNVHPFAPKRSKSIHRSFYKHNKIPENENDIWVERLVLGGKNGPQTCFKSLYSEESRKEPPTGATTIIYLADMIERKQPSKPSQKHKQKKQAKGKEDKGSSKNKNKKDIPPKQRGSIFGFFKKSGDKK